MLSATSVLYAISSAVLFQPGRRGDEFAERQELRRQSMCSREADRGSTTRRPWQRGAAATSRLSPCSAHGARIGDAAQAHVPHAPDPPWRMLGAHRIHAALAVPPRLRRSSLCGRKQARPNRLRDCREKTWLWHRDPCGSIVCVITCRGLSRGAGRSSRSSHRAVCKDLPHGPVKWPTKKSITGFVVW